MRLSRDLAVAAALGLLALSIYLLSGSSDLKHNGDTDLRYQTTQAMVDHHRLWIAHPMWLDTRVARGRGGHLYAFYAPGQAVLMIPLYVVGRFLAHHLSLPYDVTTLYAARSLDLFLGAFLAALFFIMARSLGYTARVAAVLTLIFAFATVAWPDAQSALEQTQVGLFLLLSVFAAWMFVQGGMRNRLWLVLAGTALGLAVFTRYDMLLYVPVVALFPAVLRWRRSRPVPPDADGRPAQRAAPPLSGETGPVGEAPHPPPAGSHAARGIARDWTVLGAAFLPWVGLVALWDYARFGNVLSTGLHERTLGEPFWLGLLGLTVSPGKGLLWYLPLVFLLPWAAGRFVRTHRALTVLFAALAAVPLLFYSNLLYWHGDPAWGPRYLYTAVPYLILPLGVLLQEWRTRRVGLRLAVVALVAVSLVIQVSAVSVTQWRFWYRLEQAEETTSQPFLWGATHYHYYWDVRWSPLLIQPDDVYQVLRLDLTGARQYRLTARPTRCVLPVRCLSNPADNYPVNTLAFWWADVRHPLLGPHARLALAALLVLLSLASAVAVAAGLRASPRAGGLPTARLAVPGVPPSAAT